MIGALTTSSAGKQVVARWEAKERKLARSVRHRCFGCGERSSTVKHDRLPSARLAPSCGAPLNSAQSCGRPALTT
jgi:hypothetical protein